MVRHKTDVLYLTKYSCCQRQLAAGGEVGSPASLLRSASRTRTQKQSPGLFLSLRDCPVRSFLTQIKKLCRKIDKTTDIPSTKFLQNKWSGTKPMFYTRPNTRVVSGNLPLVEMKRIELSTLRMRTVRSPS